MGTGKTFPKEYSGPLIESVIIPRRRAVRGGGDDVRGQSWSPRGRALLEAVVRQPDQPGPVEPDGEQVAVGLGLAAGRLISSAEKPARLLVKTIQRPSGEKCG